MQDIFENFGIYLHVPFCTQNCDFCRFYKRIPTIETLNDYVDSIAKEIELAKSEFNFKKPETMFWGGGTPSILSEKNFEKLAKSFGNFLPSKEWSVEVAPTNVTTSKLKTLKDIGVNRISMGVQSFNEKTLKILGRKHTLKATMQAIEKITDTNFEHFSIDLIFGSDEQTEQEWIDDITKAASLPVDHISAYCLEFESATSCCAGIADNAKYEQAEREGVFLEIAMNLLPELGFNQYEISNYSKPNAQCLHNISTWNMAEWLGMGAAAASQINRQRFRNVPDFDKWRNSVWTNNPERIDIVNLDDDEIFSDALIFGLRMVEGVDISTLKKRFPNADTTKYTETLDFLANENLLEKSGDKLKLTSRGRLIADAIAVELL